LVTISPAQQLLEFVAAGRLVFNNPPDLRQLNDIAAGHSNVKLAPELVDLLLALLARGQVSVMSLIRTVNGGPHGVQVGKKFVCRAVDISAFRGRPVTLSDPAAAIRVVTDLISSFPVGSYALGFPRPRAGVQIDGHATFNHDEDVFFPVADQTTADLAFIGHILMEIDEMMEPAQTEVRRAMISSGGQFVRLFPDGKDHLHVEAAAQR
jgi:hypothetical protein